jgi:hypothetical protein
MAYERIKTEMHGDTSRWGHREDIKRAADRLRREADKRAAAEGETEREPCEILTTR